MAIKPIYGIVQYQYNNFIAYLNFSCAKIRVNTNISQFGMIFTEI